MNIKTDAYSVQFDDVNQTVSIDGVLRLNGMDEYQPIIDLLDKCIESGSKMTLNLEKLELLNSSGIAMLAKFVIKVRNLSDFTLLVYGSADNPWQSKSLVNLKRLYPALELEFK